MIASLVRSNPKSQIGFLGVADAEQRINVLCTRARCGFIVLGNAECLEARAPVWKRLMAHLRANRSVFEGLPAKCQRHGVRLKTNAPESLVLSSSGLLAFDAPWYVVVGNIADCVAQCSFIRVEYCRLMKLLGGTVHGRRRCVRQQSCVRPSSWDNASHRVPAASCHASVCCSATTPAR